MKTRSVPISPRSFRIGELSKELKVKKSVIRFWEKEFGLNSLRSEGGQRFYINEDLKTFNTIKYFLRQRGFTIIGAKEELAKINKSNDGIVEETGKSIEKNWTCNPSTKHKEEKDLAVIKDKLSNLEQKLVNFKKQLEHAGNV